MNILYVTTISTTMGFFRSFIGELTAKGHNVDIACSNPEGLPSCYKEYGCSSYRLSCSRSPLNHGNLKAIKEIKAILDKKHYDIVHCHTPIAAACTRIACRKARKQGLKVIYTAHGFHFHKGCPVKSWLLFYPVEKLCAKYTDVLITINQEDHSLATRKLHAGEIRYVPGVGVEPERCYPDAAAVPFLRQKLAVPEDAFFLLSVGELNSNKNHETVIRALAQINDDKIHYAIAGDGPLAEHLNDLIDELHLSNQVHLLGYRTDAPDLYRAADLYIHPSYREGLPMAVMEAMASGLACVVSDIRGNHDLIDNQKGGYLCRPQDVDAFSRHISALKEDPVLRQSFAAYNTEKVRMFTKDIVAAQLFEIYHI